jgi:hypothetical protein
VQLPALETGAGNSGGWRISICRLSNWAAGARQPCTLSLALWGAQNTSAAIEKRRSGGGYAAGVANEPRWLHNSANCRQAGGRVTSRRFLRPTPQRKREDFSVRLAPLVSPAFIALGRRFVCTPYEHHPFFIIIVGTAFFALCSRLAITPECFQRKTRTCNS